MACIVYRADYPPSLRRTTCTPRLQSRAGVISVHLWPTVTRVRNQRRQITRVELVFFVMAAEPPNKNNNEDVSQTSCCGRRESRHELDLVSYVPVKYAAG